MVSNFTNRNLTTNRKNRNFGYGLVFFGSVFGFGSVMCSARLGGRVALPKTGAAGMCIGELLISYTSLDRIVRDSSSFAPDSGP